MKSLCYVSGWHALFWKVLKLPNRNCTVQRVLSARPNFCETSISLFSSNMCIIISAKQSYYYKLLDVIKSPCAIAYEVNSSPGQVESFTTDSVIRGYLACLQGCLGELHQRSAPVWSGIHVMHANIMINHNPLAFWVRQ